MIVVPSEIVENYGNFDCFVTYFKFKMTVLVSRSSVFSGNVTMVSYFKISLHIFFITNMTTISRFEIFFIFVSHCQRFANILSLLFA